MLLFSVYSSTHMNTNTLIPRFCQYQDFIKFQDYLKLKIEIQKEPVLPSIPGWEV